MESLVRPRRLDFVDIGRRLNGYAGHWVRVATNGIEAYGTLTLGYVAAPGLMVWDLEHAGRVIGSLQLREGQVPSGELHDDHLAIQTRFDEVTVAATGHGFDGQPPPGTLRIGRHDGFDSLRRVP